LLGPDLRCSRGPLENAVQGGKVGWRILLSQPLLHAQFLGGPHDQVFDLKILLAAVMPVCHKRHLGQKITANGQLELIP
jgi:hypothetical protein